MAINKQRIQFDLGGDTIVGDLYLPDGPCPFPAVVVGGPMTSVKEQVTGVYAEALARVGIASLAIDHRHYGESAGEPRQCEYYPDKIEDLRNALSFLGHHDLTDPLRIGVVGVCLGSGYAVHASVGHPLVKAIGCVAGYYRDVPAIKEADPDGFAKKIQQGVDARLHYERTGEVITIPAVALDQDAAMTLQDTFDYYGTARAAVPNYTNEFAVMSREHFLQFDVQTAAGNVAVPVTMVHSRKALSPHWATKFYDALTVDKSIHWLDSIGQVDFYDDPVLVNDAAGLIFQHFQTVWG